VTTPSAPFGAGLGLADERRALILTLAMDGESFAYLDGLRRRHFPPERNVVPAHITLFHALPGEERALIVRELDGICRRQPRLTLQATGLRSLGRGVAFSFSAPALVSLRNELAREWRDWLTPQDSQRFAPHATVQNKASGDQARALLRELEAGFQPFEVRGEGLHLWRYLGGPWRLEKTFRFAG
jgi:2'-5' RNA ligase